MISVRDYRDGDLQGIAELQAYVEPEMSVPPAEFEALWRWMYAKNPYGPLRVVVAQDEAGRIVGHEGIMPFRLSVDGVQVTGGITGNLIVKQELRGSLLFPRLVSALVKGLPPAGFDIGYGPVRPKMYGSMLALGYRDMGLLPVYVRPYDLTKIAAYYLHHPVACALSVPFMAAAQTIANGVFRTVTSVAVQPVERFGDRHSSFLDSASRQFPIHAVRTPQTLNWRFFAAPNRRYEVYEVAQADGERGYVALRRMPMLGFDAIAIVDILFPLKRPEIGKALLALVHRRAVEEGVTIVACMLNDGNPVIPLLRRFGFLRAPEGFSMIVYEPKSREPIFHPDMMQRWYATWFDHDYV